MRVYRKYLILCLIFGLGIVSLAAQNRVTLGTGTSSAKRPFGAEYGYERSAAIYLSSQIGQTGTITNLSWYVNTVATGVLLPTRIYLKTTTSTEFLTNPGTWSAMISGATLVFDRNKLFYINGWNSIDITDYNYTGNNLVVMCETNYGGGGPASWPTFYYTTSTNRLAYWQASTNPPTGNGTQSSNRPNLRITFDGTPVNPRHVAEWERLRGALVAYSGEFGVPVGMIREMSETVDIYLLVSAAQQTTAVNALTVAGVPSGKIHPINKTVESYWTRDYGPQFIYVDGPTGRELRIVDHAYSRPARPRDNESPAAVATYLGIGYYDSELIDTGGNIMSNGLGRKTATNLLQVDNPDKTLTQIQAIYSRYYGATDLQLYADPWSSYIDHIDCWAKVLPGNKVIIAQVPAYHANYTAMESVATAWATNNPGDTIYRVYTPNGEPYTNSFFVNTDTVKKILVPQMGNANDASALAVYSSALPSGYEVIGVLATGSDAWLGEDAIHCRVNMIPYAVEDETLPVELSSFAATLSVDNYINLMWVTQSETNVQGFYILRNSSDDLATALSISELISATNTSQQQSYIYTDRDVFEPGTYYYWLQNADMDGTNNFHGPISVDYLNSGSGTPQIPQLTELKPIYPNPFNPVAYIPFSIANRADVSFTIYNSRGQQVYSKVLGAQNPGNHQIEWDGRDIYGQNCSTGIYFVRMNAGSQSFIRKAVMIK